MFVPNYKLLPQFAVFCVLTAPLISKQRFSFEAADRPNCHGFYKVKIPSKFEIHLSENLIKECSHGEALIQRPLASPLY